MKSLVMSVLLAVAAGSLWSATCERQYLWEKESMPLALKHQVAVMVEERGKDFKADEHRIPYLEWCAAPANACGACMILIPGGGYYGTGDLRDIHRWRDRLTEEGVQCAILCYRTGRPGGGKPIYMSGWIDGQRAVRLVRSQAAKRGFDPERIGAMGMSAGSHLTALLAVSSQTNAYARVDAVDDRPCHLNWACTFALAYALDDGIGEKNARFGDAADVRLDPVFAFDGKTCPMWLSHGGVDAYSPFASTRFYRELRKRGIPSELHLYPDVGHADVGIDRAVEFLRQMGFLGKPAPEVEVQPRFPTDDDRGELVRTNAWQRYRPSPRGVKPCNPVLEWHFPKVLRTKAIQIVFSGGAYTGSTTECFEVQPIRRYLNAKGMTVVTMRYSNRPDARYMKHTPAWADLQRAIRMVRAEARVRGLDPERIGVCGSSAGGHLALLGALSSKRPAYLPLEPIDRESCHVNWAVAIYPAYLLTDGPDGGNATHGNDDSARPVPEFSFDLASCPVLFLHGDADVYASMGSVKFWEQLNRMGIQGEVHTLATRGHCFQRKASPGTGSYTYLDRIWEFLLRKKFVTPEEK